jgi:hypothetical protein
MSDFDSKRTLPNSDLTTSSLPARPATIAFSLREAIRRREFIAIAGGAAAWPLLAEAAQQSAMPVVGFLGTGTAESTTSELRGFRQGLAEAGYIEGRNLTVEYSGRRGKAIDYLRSRPISFTIKWLLSL